MEPVTVGALVATALAMAAEAGLKGAVGEAVKDGYKALKTKVAAWAGSDVDALEKMPGSPARRSVVAEVVDAQPPDEKDSARALAQQLIAALRGAAGGPIGLDISRLDALAVDLSAITVTEGTGARIGEVRVLGTFKTGPIDVGKPPGK
jgi:hypothetical protein